MAYIEVIDTYKGYKVGENTVVAIMELISLLKKVSLL